MNRCENCGAPATDNLCQSCYQQFSRLSTIIAKSKNPDSPQKRAHEGSHPHMSPQKSPEANRSSSSTKVGISVQCFYCGQSGNYLSLGNLEHSCGQKFFACPCPACKKIGSWARKGALRCVCGHAFYGDICHTCGDVFVCDENLFPGVFVHDKCRTQFTAMVCPTCKEIGHWDVSGRILHCKCGSRFFATYCRCGKFASWQAEAVPGILVHSSCGEQYYCDVCPCGDIVLWNKDAFPGMLSHKNCGSKFLALACPYCHKISHWNSFGHLRCLCGKQFKVSPEQVSGTD